MKTRLTPWLLGGGRRGSNASFFGLRNAHIPLKFIGRFLTQFAKQVNAINVSIGTLTPLILVRIQVPQPA